MIADIFILVCILSCTVWAFQDFYKSAWTPNQRLATGIIYALVAFFITVTSFASISDTENVLMSSATVILFIAVIFIEFRSNKQAITRNNHKDN